MYKFLNKILIPFVIIHVRIIQYRYKRITTNNYFAQSNRRIATLQLLQAKEYYYERQFDAWGKFHPRFSFSDSQLRRHDKFMEWLFPEKDFKEWPLVIWHNPRAVTYYQNKIFALQNGSSCLYEIEIPKQIKAWKNEHKKALDENIS